MLFLRSGGWHNSLNKEIRALGILSKIWGEPSKKAEPSVAEAEAALARLASERSAAQAEINELQTKRRSLLLVDDSDREIAAVDKASAAAELRLERLEEAEPGLVAGLTAARTRRRQAEWEQICDEYFPAAATYLAAMRDARQAFDAVTGIIGKAQNRGFAAEATSLFPFPIHLLDVELLKRLDVAVERAEAAAYAPPRPAAPPAAAAPAPSPSMPAGKSKPAALATVEILEPPVAVGGVPPGRPGEVKRGVPADVAWGWVRSGVAKFVGAPPPEPAGPQAPSPSPPKPPASLPRPAAVAKPARSRRPSRAKARSWSSACARAFRCRTGARRAPARSLLFPPPWRRIGCATAPPTIRPRLTSRAPRRTRRRGSCPSRPCRGRTPRRLNLKKSRQQNDHGSELRDRERLADHRPRKRGKLR